MTRLLIFFSALCPVLAVAAGCEGSPELAYSFLCCSGVVAVLTVAVWQRERLRKLKKDRGEE